jgi:hypothetical protein
MNWMFFWRARIPIHSGSWGRTGWATIWPFASSGLTQRK